MSCSPEMSKQGWLVVRCLQCGEKLIPIPVKGGRAFYPSVCRNGHPTGVSNK